MVIDAQQGFPQVMHDATITVTANTGVNVLRTGTRSGNPQVFTDAKNRDAVELTPATLAKLSFDVTTKDRMNGTCQDKDNDKRPTATWWKSEDSKCVEVKLKPKAAPYDREKTPFANLLLNPANPFIINFKSIDECDDFKNQVANIVLNANAAPTPTPTPNAADAKAPTVVAAETKAPTVVAAEAKAPTVVAADAKALTVGAADAKALTVGAAEPNIGAAAEAVVPPNITATLPMPPFFLLKEGSADDLGTYGLVLLLPELREFNINVMSSNNSQLTYETEAPSWFDLKQNGSFRVKVPGDFAIKIKQTLSGVTYTKTINIQTRYSFLIADPVQVLPNALVKLTPHFAGIARIGTNRDGDEITPNAVSGLPLKVYPKQTTTYHMRNTVDPDSMQLRNNYSYVKVIVTEPAPAPNVVAAEPNVGAATAPNVVAAEPNVVATAPNAVAPAEVPLFGTCDVYFRFEQELKDNVQLQPKDSSIKLTNTASFKPDDWGTETLKRSLDWADASIMCSPNETYVEYDDSEITMRAFDVPPERITIEDTTHIHDDGWCFYNALLTAAGLPHTMQDCRKFALDLSNTILSNVSESTLRSNKIEVKVNGYDVRISEYQLVKLFSIPNFNNKNTPCVFGDTGFLGNAAAVILNKNILIYSDYDGSRTNCERVGIHVVTDLTNPKNNIMLRRGAPNKGKSGENHFDIITQFKVTYKGHGGSKTKRNAKPNINTKRPTKRLMKRNAKHNKLTTKRNNKHIVEQNNNNGIKRFTKRKGNK